MNPTTLSDELLAVRERINAAVAGYVALVCRAAEVLAPRQRDADAQSLRVSDDAKSDTSDALAPSSTTSGLDVADRSVAATVEVSAASPSASELPIVDYDLLAASHVVQRLAQLSVAELEVVRAYEASGRGRRTILAKVDQLLAGDAA